jgi:ATP-binding cassette, subfamily B, bacterial MsbA
MKLFASFSGVIQISRHSLRHWRIIALAMLAAASYSALEGGFVLLIGPYVKYFQELAQNAKDTPPATLEAIYSVGWKLLMLAPAIAIASWSRQYFGGWALARVVADMRNAVCDAILPQSLSFFDDRRSGDLMSRITNDVNGARTAFNILICNMPRQFFTMCMGLGLAIYMNWRLLLAGAILVPLIFVPISQIARYMRRYGKEGLEKLSNLTDQMSQMFNGIRIIKAFMMEDAESQEFHRVNERYYSKQMKLALMRGLSQGFMELCVRAIMGACFVVGAWLIAKGTLKVNIGELVVFAIGLYFAFYSLRKLLKSYNNLQASIPAADRVMELISHTPKLVDAPDAQALEHVTKSIAFENVSFAYAEETILDGVSFTCQPGEHVAIVGKSGAGKSTLISLLMRFYDVSDGAITLDGTDLRQITRESLLGRMAIVSQATFLFNRSIADNIRFGRRDATQEEIEEAAKLAHIHDFVVGLPDGYDTLCGEFGGKLSGGQRQRIAIARALVKDADILILDEAMVGLDTESEAIVRKALSNLMADRTTFMITHDLPTIRDADRILVFRDGKLIAQGTHDNLTETCEEYRTLRG